MPSRTSPSLATISRVGGQGAGVGQVCACPCHAVPTALAAFTPLPGSWGQHGNSYPHSYPAWSTTPPNTLYPAPPAVDNNPVKDLPVKSLPGLPDLQKEMSKDLPKDTSMDHPKSELLAAVRPQGAA